jgi:hypothetical protein
VTSRFIRSGFSEHPGQSRDHRPISPVQLRLGILPPQHRDLLAKYQQLGVLRCVRARKQYHPPRQAGEHQVEHPYRHEPAILPCAQPTPLTNPQVSYLCHRFGTPQGRRSLPRKTPSPRSGPDPPGPCPTRRRPTANTPPYQKENEMNASKTTQSPPGRGVGTTYRQRRRTDEQHFVVTDFEPDQEVTVRTLPPARDLQMSSHSRAMTAAPG